MSLTTMKRPTIALPGLRRITVDEYERIIASGSLEDPEKVELIDGYMVEKMAKSAEHGFSTRRSFDLLSQRVPSGWSVRKEEPVRMPPGDEPEPDISVVRGSVEDYEHRLPAASDVGLVAEVSVATLDRDRYEKAPSYARGRIPVYWIINLVDRQVEVYTLPGPDGYASCQVYPEGRAVPVEIGGSQVEAIDVSSLLPSRRPAAPS